MAGLPDDFLCPSHQTPIDSSIPMLRDGGFFNGVEVIYLTPLKSGIKNHYAARPSGHRVMAALARKCR